MTTTTPRAMAIIGAGVIGLSWARLARDHGWRVAITDPSPQLEQWVQGEFGADDPLVTWSHDQDEVVQGADLVQENGPERLPLKKQIFGALLKTAPSDAVLATSSSSIAASLIAEDFDRADRIIVGHPFNPPALMPLVEVVPGNKTSDDTVARAVRLYGELDRAPVVIRKELPGFVANRLQMAMTREAQYLVESGVVGVGEFDAILQNSLGLRWATIGLFEGNVLGGGVGGARHLFAGVGAETGQIELGTPSRDPEVVEKLIGDIEAAYGVGEATYDRLVAKRDLRTRAVLNALQNTT
ncbi:3-hydroxyacyl-CoA dehydrogenase NAD-binding domain-containing protein [Mycobacterium sp.]|uniref:3-hydroxyacyl-CoA dehydrogenase NAD-binding domain-containing protein n=1 Tax=Mycobacterium sp. TaxID=1785 RepID=UPI002C77947F|nr:3-hydroxyacyl-CoA dehydrogenase NAD-binding domain-containing protein [Mycobacterium sp.]HTQ23040.1 3-hydroxyacyl-CoA dehydrogenase NAD-binding domain-containing protein [Mycobacterium sp.]